MTTTSPARSTRGAARAQEDTPPINGVEMDIDVTAEVNGHEEEEEETTEEPRLGKTTEMMGGEEVHAEGDMTQEEIIDEEGRVMTAEELEQLGPGQIQVIDEEGRVVVLTQEQMRALAEEHGAVIVEEDWANQTTTDGGDTNAPQMNYDDDFEDDDDAPPPLKMYSTDRLPDFDGVAWALRFAPEDKLNTHWIPVRLPLNLKNAAFMIDVTKLADPRDCHVDGYGSWGTPNGQYHMYDVDRVQKTITRLDRGRNMRSENQRKIIDEFAFKVTRLRYKHPVERNFHKIVYQISTAPGVHKRTLIAYEWHIEAYEVYGLPHGNCRHTAESFQPSLPSQRVRRPYVPAHMRRPRKRPAKPDEGARPPRVRPQKQHEPPPHPLPMPQEFIVYSTDRVPPMQEAASILRFAGEEYVNRMWARLKLPLHVRRAAFLVDLQALDSPLDVHIDGYGTWEHPQSYSHFYTCDDAGKTLQRIETAVTQRAGVRDKREPDAFDYRVRQLRYWHPIENRFRKFVFKMSDANDTPMRALVWYDWDTRPYDIGIKTDNLTQRAQRYPLFEPAIELTADEAAQQAQEDAEEAASLGVAVETLNADRGQPVDYGGEPQESKLGSSNRAMNEPVVVITGQGHMYVQPRFPPTNEPEEEVLELNFTTDPVPPFDDVAHELRFGSAENINRHWARVRLANDVKRINFLVDLTALRDPKSITRDGQGRWGSASAAIRSHYYGDNVEEQVVMRLDCGIDRDRVPKDGYSFRVQQARFRHSVDPYLRKTIYTLYSEQAQPQKALVCYSRELNTNRDGDADEMSMLYWGDEVEESEHSRRAAALRQVVVYHTGASPAFDEAARILKFGDDSLLNRRWFTVLLPSKRRRACFLVDFFAWKLNNTKDAYGVWQKSSGGTVYYNIDENSHNFIRLNCGRDGRYYIPPKYDARLVRMRQKHPLEPNFHRWTYCLWTQDGECSRALICYQWLCPPYDLAAVIRGRLAEQGRIHRAPTTPNLYYVDGRVDMDEEQEEGDYDDEEDTQMMGDVPGRLNHTEDAMMVDESMLNMTSLGDAPNATPIVKDSPSGGGRRGRPRRPQAGAPPTLPEGQMHETSQSQGDEYDFVDDEPVNVTDDVTTTVVKHESVETRSGRRVTTKRSYSPPNADVASPARRGGRRGARGGGRASAGGQQSSLSVPAESETVDVEDISQQQRVTPITVDEWQELRTSANDFCQAGQVRNFRGDRYTVQDDVYILQVQRMRVAPRSIGGSGSGPTTGGVQYRCLGIPVPGAESLGCSQFVHYRYVCPHTLAVAQHCCEREAFVNFVMIATGSTRSDMDGLDEEDAFDREEEDDMHTLEPQQQVTVDEQGNVLHMDNGTIVEGEEEEVERAYEQPSEHHVIQEEEEEGIDGGSPRRMATRGAQQQQQQLIVVVQEEDASPKRHSGGSPRVTRRTPRE